jgi:acetyl/propionyl-CoA carboxylase alpha subunit
VKTVAIYSDAKAGVPHVRAVDTAASVGPAPVSESHPNIKSIITAAGQIGAEALHPGHGLLLERADLAEGRYTKALIPEIMAGG